jgi:hypothetical protein
MTQRIAQTVLYSAHKPADVTEEILVRLNGSAESAEPPSAEPPAKAAVVDVAKLFAAHRNLNRRLNDLKVEVAALEEQFAKQEDEIMRMQAARDEGEPEARPSIEKKLSDSEAEMAAVGRRLEAQEARIYEEAYDELLADVARYARRHDLRVVYRKLEPASPKQAGESNVSNATLQRMNRPVVYVRVEPTDITPAILDHWAQSEESARGK